MPKGILLAIMAVASLSTGCSRCEPQCDDTLRVFPVKSLDAGAWPQMSAYTIEILVGEERFECDGYFRGSGDDVWTCSEGVEAHSRIKWEMPFFIIHRSRDEVDHLKAVDVKIWREGVLIFDDAIEIDWDRVNDASTDIQPCDNLGCWAGGLQAVIQNFERLEEPD